MPWQQCVSRLVIAMIPYGSLNQIKTNESSNVNRDVYMFLAGTQRLVSSKLNREESKQTFFQNDKVKIQKEGLPEAARKTLDGDAI